MKIFIDSRHRTNGQNEDFIWQLPASVDLPDSICYVDEVLVPNCIYSIVAGVNDRIRFLEDHVAAPGATAVIWAKECVIPEGQYNGITLADALQTAMRSVTTFSPQTQISVVFDTARAKLKISLAAPNNSQVRIFPDGALASFNSQQGLYTVDLSNTQSAGKVCGFLGTAVITASTTTDAFGDSVIDVQRHHACYIHSDLAQPGSTIGALGESDIIRRVVIQAPQNGLAVDRHSTQYDYIDVPSMPLRSMRFRLAGVDGKTINLHGHHWSFSLIFHEKV
tara:strand:+ start:784 stop:1620 length:837 start_codon:yes stop_codon:yes gene_type:complete